jgi:hypothetical protein
MKNELAQWVRKLCLAFPEAEELTSHGMPNYRVRGKKIFATFAMNHHGDGRIALWLNTPAEMQDAYVRAEPKYFFVPPYVGPGGWLGVRLDTGLAWKRIAPIVQVAYERVAPAKLFGQLKRWWVTFWVGVHAQLLMTDDPRYTIPAYMGHNGWIALEVTRKHNESELESLALESYRHFALKRMLAQLPD